MLPAADGGFPRRFGPYVLVQQLAEGGMGQVYLALTGTREANRLCVIKRIANTANGSAPHIPELCARFEREAEIAMALSHGSIVQTFSAGQEDGLYLVQEYVHGASLGALMSALKLQSELMPITVASHIVLQVGRALAYLHNFQSQGLIHRDVTPENIMLAESGEVKLIDFGVAKATAWSDGLTQEGAWFGKPDWVAPELPLGRSLDRRSDLYSLGLVYWHLLTGKHPGSEFIDPSQWAACLPAASTYNSMVSEDLDRIVSKAISYDPELRFQTAEELQDAVNTCVPLGLWRERELATFLSRHLNPRHAAALTSMVGRASRLLDPSRTFYKSKSPLRRAGVWRRAVLPLMGLAALGITLGFRLSTPGARLAPQTTASREQPPPTAIEPTPVSAPYLPEDSDAGPQPEVETPLSSAARRPAASRVHKPRPVAPQPASSPVEDAEQIFASAMESFERSELRGALDLAEQSARLGAGAKAHILIGRIRAIERDFVRARAAFEEALRLAPDNPEVKRRLQTVLRPSQEGIL